MPAGCGSSYAEAQFLIDIEAEEDLKERSDDADNDKSHGQEGSNEVKNSNCQSRAGKEDEHDDMVHGEHQGDGFCLMAVEHRKGNNVEEEEEDGEYH